MTFRTEGQAEPVGIKVMDQDDATDDDLMGTATFDIADHKVGAGVVDDLDDISRPWRRDVWLELTTDSGKPGGKIHVVIEWDPLTASVSAPEDASGADVVAVSTNPFTSLASKAVPSTISSSAAPAGVGSSLMAEHLIQRVEGLEAAFKTQSTSTRERLGDIFLKQNQVLHRLTHEL